MPHRSSSLPPRPFPPPDDLITPTDRDRLFANGRRSAAGADIDPRPVVKLHGVDFPVVWLISEADPAEPDRLFGLADVGLGFPELGYFSLDEIRALRGPLGLPVETDQGFVADRPLSNYAAVAHDRRRIET